MGGSVYLSFDQLFEDIKKSYPITLIKFVLNWRLDRALKYQKPLKSL